MRAAVVIAVALAAPIPAAAEAAPSIEGMRGHARVLLIATPTLGGKRYAEQRRALAGWRRGAAARDLRLVAVSGTQVVGADDRATLLRRRWHLPPGDFQVVLIGKDGHEAFRASRPVPAAVLQRTIDAMPMRRAGQR